MYIDDALLTKEEKTALALRKLYSEAGYDCFRMNKFETYDLYMRNKDFLVSEAVIAFTDTNGRMMALKPDVTLSIVKNSRYSAGHPVRLYYDEKVYRPGRRGDPFREITQLGLEILGDIGTAETGEALSLAAETLKTVSADYVLDISCTELLSGVLDEMGAQGEVRIALLGCVSQKALHEVERICLESGIGPEGSALLKTLLSCEGEAKPAADRLEASLPFPWAAKSARLLRDVLSITGEERIRLDLSVQSDMRYYNGIVFSGFVPGVPEAVLRGGQYGRLLKRMGKEGSAIGFALYPDLLD